ncbi:MAG: hypothetical protein AB1696_19085 [Planctomycetota bacterium]
MPIKVKCKECGKQFVLKDDFAGKQGKCPSCGKSLTVPPIEKKEEEPAPKPKEPTAKHEVKRPAPLAEQEKLSSKDKKTPLHKDDKEPASKPEEKKAAPSAEEKKPSSKGDKDKEASPKPTKKTPPEQKKREEQIRCPGCGAMFPKGTLVCVRCGTNMVTGARGATHVSGTRLAGVARTLRILIGLSIVAVIIAAIGLVVSKTLTSYKIAGRVADNERMVVKDLRRIANAQKAFRRQALVDQNNNGIGEYGLLAELVNEVCVRDLEGKLTSKDGPLSCAFATGGAEGDGAARRWGYRFRMFLATPDKGEGDDKVLGGASDLPGKMLDDKAVVEIQEKSFICYAWPEVRYADGIHAFVIDQSDSVYFTKMDSRPYEGERGPEPGAAYADSSGFGKDLASGKRSDDNTWTPIPDPDTVAWKSAFVSGLIFDLSTPWFMPEAVKTATKPVDIEEKCREALNKQEVAKQRENQGNWQDAERFYTEALQKLGKETWPEKTLARRIELRLAAVRLVLQAGKLEAEKKWAEARDAYSKALADVNNVNYIQKKLTALTATEGREATATDLTAATKAQDAAKRAAEAKQFAALCEKYPSPYALWAACEYYLSVEDHKELQQEAKRKKEEIVRKIKADPKACPPLREEKGRAFDVIRLKNKDVIKGKVTERTDMAVKVEVAGPDGQTLNRLLNKDDVVQVETKEIPAADLNRERAEQLYTEGVKCWRQGMFVHALDEFGKLKYYFADAAVQSDAALQKKLAGAVSGAEKLPDKLSPTDLVAASVEGGEGEMCPICLGSRRLTCTYCKGTGLRAEKTRCPICDGTGKSACSVCRGTRVRQGNCATCGTRGTIECITCNGKGKVRPYIQCEVCKGSGRSEERCLKCRGAGTDSKTRQPCDACGGSGKIPCGVCNGKGNRIDEKKEITCRECQGQGRIACPNCAGTGKAPVGGRCTRCNGKGKFQCTKCKGEGRVDGKPCPVCKGARDLPCEACKGVGKPICRACDGAGKETCNNCKGTGEANVKCRHCDESHTLPCGHCGETGKRRVK